MRPDLVDPMAQFGYDVSPGVGDLRALQRGRELYGKAGQALRQGQFMPAASYAAQGLTEDISAIPGIGEIATGAKAAGQFLPAVGGLIAGKTAKGADLKKLEQAKRMNLESVDRKAIWDETGWYMGPDGQWRFEIPDTDMKTADMLNPRVETAMDQEKLDVLSYWLEPEGLDYLQNWLQHKKLESNYPDMAGMFYSDDPHLPSGTRGKYLRVSPDQKDLFKNNEPMEAVISNTRDKTEGDWHNALLHEIQHAIQMREKFTPGAGLKVSKNTTFSDVDNYWRAGGEVESRNVQARHKKIMEMKTAGASEDEILKWLKDNPPWTTQDVTEDRMIQFSRTR